MSEILFQTLLDKYISGSITEDERILLHQMLEVSSHREELATIIDKELHDHSFEMEDNKNLLSLIQNNIQQNIKVKRKPSGTVMVYIKRLAVAAVIILLAGAGMYVLFTPDKKPAKELAEKTAPVIKTDIHPGGNRAILKLANGSEIVLDSANQGTLAQQGGVKIIKLNNGQLLYNKPNEITTEVNYNTIITPKGGQYQLILADGSKAWLNAASSLRFPASFTGSERKVELTGEGYFEVAKNAAMPFVVSVNDLSIKVLGTHFNVNAYTNETFTRTTLLEGSVRISQKSKASILKPGQQARADPSGKIEVLDNVDVDEVIAWKNGLFQFKGSNLETILRQAARWYDVDFEYKSKINSRFSGQISRNVNASQLLRILELTGKVHFEIEGRKILVKS